MIDASHVGTWVGNIWGTYAGNAVLEITEANGKILVEFSVNINGQVIVLGGPVAFLDGKDIATTRSDTALGSIEATFIFEHVEAGRLEGKWRQLDQNNGIFQFNRKAAQAVAVSDVTPSAIQIIQRTGHLPKITIYRDEIKSLILIMNELMPSNFEVVVKAVSNKKEITRLNSQFWTNPSLPRMAEFLSLNLSEPSNGIARNISVTLGERECSFSVLGTDQVWVEGAFQSIDSVLRRYHSGFRNFYEKHALNLNGIMFLIVLGLLPSLDVVSRFVLIAVMMIMVASFKILHSSTTALRIILGDDRPKTSLLNVSELVTLLVGTALVASVPFAYSWLRDEGLKSLLEWINKSIVGS